MLLAVTHRHFVAKEIVCGGGILAAGTRDGSDGQRGRRDRLIGGVDGWTGWMDGNRMGEVGKTDRRNEDR